jgi:hypothetical protein
LAVFYWILFIFVFIYTAEWTKLILKLFRLAVRLLASTEGLCSLEVTWPLGKCLFCVWEHRSATFESYPQWECDTNNHLQMLPEAVTVITIVQPLLPFRLKDVYHASLRSFRSRQQRTAESSVLILRKPDCQIIYFH